METSREIVDYIEMHDLALIRQYFERGGSPNDTYLGKPLFQILIEMYLRSPAFSPIVRLFADHGLIYEDTVLLSVWLNDAEQLEKYLSEDAQLVHKIYTIPNATFTPLEEVTLLHVCAEYNLVACAERLIRHGALVDAPAGLDEYGFGGQTPIFHTVNQNNHNGGQMMRLLLKHRASLQKTVCGIVWGKGYEWETLIPAVNPVSYAMMGSLPQMQRKEATVAAIVAELLKTAYGIDYPLRNVPNKYLSGH